MSLIAYFCDFKCCTDLKKKKKIQKPAVSTSCYFVMSQQISHQAPPTWTQYPNTCRIWLLKSLLHFYCISQSEQRLRASSNKTRRKNIFSLLSCHLNISLIAFLQNTQSHFLAECLIIHVTLLAISATLAAYCCKVINCCTPEPKVVSTPMIVMATKGPLDLVPGCDVRCSPAPQLLIIHHHLLNIPTWDE